MYILLDTYSCLDAVREAANLRDLGYPQPADFARANSLTNPLGPVPARGWFLISRGDLNKLNLNASHSVTFNAEIGGSYPLYGLWITKARNLTPGTTGDTKACYLVEVADSRHKLADPYLGIGIKNKQYNVRAPDYSADGTPATNYYSASLNSGSVWTWLTMVQDLWALMPHLGTVPSALPYNPDGTPEGWIFPGVSAWKALNTVLYRLGLAVKCDLTLKTNQYSLVQIGAADSATDRIISTAEAAKTKIYDAEFVEPTATRVPGNVRLLFHRQNLHYGNEETTPRTSAQWATDPLYFVDQPSGATGADTDLFAPLWDDLPDLLDATDAATNVAGMTSRAADHATAWLGMLQTRFHKIFSGVMKIQPGSTLRAVSWRQDLLGLGGTTDPGGLVTEVFRYPYYMLPIGGDARPAEDAYCCDDATPLHPPDFRPTYPNYPHLLQKVRIASATPDSNGNYPAFVQRRNPVTRAWADKEACYAFESNGATPAAQIYTARLHGYDTDRPVYSIEIGSGGSSTAYSLISNDVTLSTNQNNYSIPGVGTNWLRVNATADFKFTGFVPRVANDFFQLLNTGTATIELPYHDGGSLAANQIQTPSAGGSSVYVRPGEGKMLKYAASTGATIDNYWTIAEEPACVKPGLHNVGMGAASYTLQVNDWGTNVVASNAGNVTISIPDTTNFPDCWNCGVENATGSYKVTITDINGNTVVLFPSQAVVVSRGTAGGGNTNGGVWLAGYLSKVANYTLTAADHNISIHFDTTAGDLVATMPAIADVATTWETNLVNDGPNLLTALNPDTSTVVVMPGQGTHVNASGGGAGFAYNPGSTNFGLNDVGDASYTLKPIDSGRLVAVKPTAAARTVTLPLPTVAGGFRNSQKTMITNYGTKTLTVNVSGGAIIDNGYTTLTILPFRSIAVTPNTTNGVWYSERGNVRVGVDELTVGKTFGAADHFRTQAYVGSGDVDLTEPASGATPQVPTNFALFMSNDCSDNESMFNYLRASGKRDGLPPGDGYITLYPTDQDAGTVGYAIQGVRRFGGESKSSNFNVTRAMHSRGIELTGAGATATLFKLDPTNQTYDLQWGCSFKNNGTGTWTLAADAADTINGQASIKIGKCQGGWLKANAPTKWIFITGVPCLTSDKAYNSSSQTVNSGVTAALTTNTAIGDQDFIVPGGANPSRFTADEDGTYELEYCVHADVVFSVNATVAPTTIETFFSLNGGGAGTAIGGEDCGSVWRINIPAGGTGGSTNVDLLHVCLKGTSRFSLSKNDYIEVYLKNNTSVNATTAGFVYSGLKTGMVKW